MQYHFKDERINDIKQSTIKRCNEHVPTLKYKKKLRVEAWTRKRRNPEVPCVYSIVLQLVPRVKETVVCGSRWKWNILYGVGGS